MNVRHLLILTLPLLISGCASFDLFGKRVQPITVKTEEVARTKLNLQEPPPLKGRDIAWVVITPENAEQVFANLKSKNVDAVLIGLTDDGYEALSLTMAEIKNYIAQQRSIIIQYKNYYEPEEKDKKK